MAASLSPDLRILIRAVEGGLSRTAAAKRFGISPASAVRWVQSYRQTGRTRAKPCGGDRRSHRIEAQAALLLRAVQETPDSTLGTPPLSAHPAGGASTIHAFYRRHGFTFKKRPRWGTGARRRVASAKPGALSRSLAQPNSSSLMRLASRLSWRRHGRAPRGQRCRAAIPHGHLVCGLRLEGLVAPMLLDGRRGLPGVCGRPARPHAAGGRHCRAR